MTAKATAKIRKVLRQPRDEQAGSTADRRKPRPFFPGDDAAVQPAQAEHHHGDREVHGDLSLVSDKLRFQRRPEHVSGINQSRLSSVIASGR